MCSRVDRLTLAAGNALLFFGVDLEGHVVEHRTVTIGDHAAGGRRYSLAALVCDDRAGQVRARW